MGPEVSSIPDSFDRPAARQILAHLEHVLCHRKFQAASQQTAFLRHIVEQTVAGKQDFIKEYVIGSEVFGRGSLFDPRVDPIVRSQARKLRTRLTLYYATDGKDDPIRIELPKGSYVPQFHFRDNFTEIATGEAAAVSRTESRLHHRGSLRRLRPRGISRKTLVGAAALIGLVLLSASLGWRNLQLLEQTTDLLAGPQNTIAVVPLRNLGGGGSEFIAEGLAHVLIEKLSRIQNLRVVARASALEFGGNGLSLREIGKRLNTQTVLGGTLTRDGDKIFVRVHLDRVSDGRRLWVGAFSDPALAESSTVKAVLGILQPDYKSDDVPAKVPQSNVYLLYLRGLYALNSDDPSGVDEAIRILEQVVTEDHEFAEGYAALAESYAISLRRSQLPALNLVARIKETTATALRLNPELGQANLALAIAYQYEFDWSAAEKAFKKGFASAPACALGRLWYGDYFAFSGRNEDFYSQARLVAQLDPASAVAQEALGEGLLGIRRYREAAEAFQRVLVLDPRFNKARRNLAVTHLVNGEPDKAIEELANIDPYSRDLSTETLLGYAYAAAGRVDQARSILNDFIGRYNRGPFPASAIAKLYTALGDKDRAFEWLDKAVDQHDLHIYLLWDHRFSPLRSDPRFPRLLQRLKLPRAGGPRVSPLDQL